MQYPKANKYMVPRYLRKIMGPNPLKLLEEILARYPLAPGSRVMDLGCGQGLTSLFLHKEYDLQVTACDLWIDPTDNLTFFREENADILPLRTDATENLPFARESFDAIVSIDSYHYFGREKGFLEERILPFVKKGGWVLLAVPGMKTDLHHDLPPCMLLSWTPEDLATIRSAAFWQQLLPNAQVFEMEGNEELWQDWLRQENPYAMGDRKAMNAGAGQYMNFVGIAIQKS